MQAIIKNIDLKKNVDSGQVFNWHDVDSSYIVPINNSLFKLTQLENLEARVELIKGDFSDLGNYFDTDNDYEKQYERISKKYPELAEASERSKGIILLKQAHLEIILTFILSSNNNIPRITKSIRTIRKNLGEKICDYKGKTYHKFPSIEALLTYTEDDFKKLGAGYRDKYLVSAIKTIAESEDFEDWEKLSDKDLILKLKQLKGVGTKVAHCIALYGYGRRKVFPVDTWIKKSLKKYYNLENLSDKEIEEKILKKFAYDSALVQQIMFYDERFPKK